MPYSLTPKFKCFFFVVFFCVCVFFFNTWTQFNIVFFNPQLLLTEVHQLPIEGKLQNVHVIKLYKESKSRVPLFSYHFPVLILVELNMFSYCDWGITKNGEGFYLPFFIYRLLCWFLVNKIFGRLFSCTCQHSWWKHKTKQNCIIIEIR